MLSRLRGHLTYANVVSTLCLFVLLGGSAFAAAKIGSAQIKNNSIKSADVKNNSLTGKDVKSLGADDFKGGALPRGPEGPAGKPGPTGAAGSARAYARVSYNALVAGESKGIVAVTEGCPGGSACTQPPATGTGVPTTLCFKLQFTPANVQVTPDAGQSNLDIQNAARDWSVHLPARPPALSHPGCPPAYQVEVAVSNGQNSDAVTGLFVAFN